MLVVKSDANHQQLTTNNQLPPIISEVFQSFLWFSRLLLVPCVGANQPTHEKFSGVFRNFLRCRPSVVCCRWLGSV